MKSAQDPEAYADRAERLQELQLLEKQGHIDLFYGDESGFSLTSAIPYGWQFAGEHVATRPRHSRRLNVLGFFSKANDFQPFYQEGSINSALVIEAISEWAATRTTATVLVLDNAKIHHSAAFQAQRLLWEEQGVYIFYLPTYSPHLNKIETLWRKTKYEWLRPEAYVDFATLTQAVKRILGGVGQDYIIQFKT